MLGALDRICIEPTLNQRLQRKAKSMLRFVIGENKHLLPKIFGKISQIRARLQLEIQI